jgi:hypothetical protein
MPKGFRSSAQRQGVDDPGQRMEGVRWKEQEMNVDIEVVEHVFRPEERSKWRYQSEFRFRYAEYKLTGEASASGQMTPF